MYHSVQPTEASYSKVLALLGDLRKYWEWDEINVQKFLRDWSKEDKFKLFSGVFSDRTRGNSNKFIYMTLRLNVKEKSHNRINPGTDFSEIG